MDRPINQEKLCRLASSLLEWYSRHRRAFPWREEPTPYRIWVSEIMLQQTRIEAALPYFDRFMQALPTVSALAQAEEGRLMKLWEGLGYYSRARNLQRAAKIVVADYGGQLPASYEELLSLPGIGEYTAGAIASMAYGLPVPAVDGNVLRVCARLLDDGGDVTRTPVKKRLRQAVCAMLPPDRPGDFNQAIMELGETVCLPNTVPLCGECPLRGGCRGRLAGHPERLPVRAEKKARRVERRTVLLVQAGGRVLLHRREDQGLLAGLWELPSAEGWLEPEQATAVAAAWGAAPRRVEPAGPGRHIFSHIEWQMQGVRILTPPFDPPEGFLWADGRRLREETALPSAFRTYSSRLPEWLAAGAEEPG
ncbi:MAG TPA: A/G-specific adenine glycosylase [Firmicutes bacterium]|nr:A/G-specific adenine glycosylase [Bacillota bacterium]